MNRAIVVLAFAGLAGCAWTTPQTNITGQQLSYRSGTGVVESVATAPKPFTAGAGGSAPASSAASSYGQPLYRLTIRMDDGKRQYIDTDSTEFTRGTRVRLTDERLIEKQ